MERKNIISSIDKLFNTPTNNYIFIYTPPKVGSTTLVTSLRVSLGKSYNIIHIHDETMLSVLTGIKNITINEIINYLANIGKNVYIIDVYRSPIERKISEFFEKISPYHFNNTEDNISKYSIKRVSDRFNKLFPHIENGDHYFDKYGIENPIPFDFEKKYTIQIVKNENLKYIKLRLCDSQFWAQVLSEIFSTDIVIIHDYKTEDKAIGTLYNKFKMEYKLPANYIEIIENCKYFNFYYNEEERSNYISMWKTKLSHEFTPYTKSEYDFYINLCLENQYINDIQIDHYIDNGCYCNFCSIKRKNIFIRAKSGEKIFEKIIHNEVVREVQTTQLQNIINNKKMTNAKFTPKQFNIHVI